MVRIRSSLSGTKIHDCQRPFFCAMLHIFLERIFFVHTGSVLSSRTSAFTDVYKRQVQDYAEELEGDYSEEYFEEAPAVEAAEEVQA